MLISQEAEEPGLKTEVEGEEGGRVGKVCAPTSRASENPSSFHYCYCYVDERGTILPSPSLSSSTLSFSPFTSIFFSLPHPPHSATLRVDRFVNESRFSTSFDFAFVPLWRPLSIEISTLFLVSNPLFRNFYFICILYIRLLFFCPEIVKILKFWMREIILLYFFYYILIFRCSLH